MEPIFYAFYIVMGLAIVKFAILIILCKGNFKRLAIAINTFFMVLVKNQTTSDENKNDDNKDENKIKGELIWPIYLLQREGRLVDFLLEDISDAPDELVGAGVREVHSKCRKYLMEKLKLQPVIKQEEGSNVTLEHGFDPGKIMLTGFLEGNPPYTGTLKHQGWQVLSSQIPEVPLSFKNNPVLAQAELEIPQK